MYCHHDPGYSTAEKTLLKLYLPRSLQASGRYRIVTNGEGWKFYRLALNGEVSESLLHGIGEMPTLLGLIRTFFGLCYGNLRPTAQ